MANITRFDPLRELEDAFKGFWLRPVLLPNGNTEMQIKTDVTEDDKAYTVHAEVPGVKKDDIKVSIEGNLVSISAEVKKEKEEKQGKQLRSERYFGSVYRSFTLEHDVDEAKAVAKYENGVLNLTLPKKSGGATKQLQIQ